MSTEPISSVFDIERLNALSVDQIDHVIFECFILDKVELIEKIFRIKERYSEIFISISDKTHPDPSVISMSVTESREITIVLPACSRIFASSFPAAMQMILWHLAHSLPLFVSYAKTSFPSGSTYLNVADDPHYFGLSFCKCDSLTTLIPDPYFMRSAAYDDLKRHYREHELDWIDRINGALWRGSTTGQTRDGDILNLPRVKLCIFALLYETVLDCGITAVVQNFDGGAEQTLSTLGILKPYLPTEDFNRWKFQIDVDGMTSSWPGLFSKLLSRSVVLKIDSKKGWEQWYYDRLIPWKHYIPVRQDFSDLRPVLDFLIANPSASERIAADAQDLMLSMTYEREISLAHRSIEQEFLKGLSR